MDARKLVERKTLEPLLERFAGGKRKVVFLLGNAPSITTFSISHLNKFGYTFGVNRILLHGNPHAVVICDREPYWQMLGRFRAYNGVKIFANQTFDPQVKCRQEETPPIPEFEFLSYNVTTDGRLTIPTFNVRKGIMSGANIAVQALQILIACGFTTIGILGVDLVYKHGNTHFWGDGSSYGAVPVNASRSIRAFRLIKQAVPSYSIFNLSPVVGPLSSVFLSMHINDFMEKYC